MAQSIHQQLILFGITPKFLYLGVERLSPSSQEEVHAWAVQVTGTNRFIMKDRYRATVNEYQAMRDGETDVTEQYMLAFVERMENLLSHNGAPLGYEEWLDVQGVSFGVTIEDTQANQLFWRKRFDNDVRCLKDFQKAVGYDRAQEFLLSTVSR
jgi:hypothetical protein